MADAQPPAPRVTVTDPAAPAGQPSDGQPLDGQVPARPARRGLRRALVVVVVAALAAGYTVGFAVGRAGRPGEQPAVDALSVAAGSQGVETTDDGLGGPLRVTVSLVLRNNGLRALRLTALTVAGTALTTPTDTVLPPGTTLPAVLGEQLACPAGLPAGDRPLRVRTDQGDRVQAFALPAVVADALPPELRRACGDRATSDALSVTSGRLRATDGGRGLTVELRLANRSARPLRVSRLLPLPGVAVAPRRGAAPAALPLVLAPDSFDPPRRTPRPEALVDLQVDLSVTDCTQASQPVEDTASPDIASLLDVLYDDESGSATVGVGTPTIRGDLAQFVRQRCARASG